MDQNSTPILESLYNKLNRPIIVGIAGDSGSGKTTYSNGIRRMFGTNMVKTIEMDGYHTESRETRAQTGHLPLDPGINKLSLLKEHLQALQEKRSIQVPIYNHQTGDFDAPQELQPSPIVIVEGLHALYPEFLPFLDFAIFVDPTREIKWSWKYKRDSTDRGHADEKLVEEMYKREAAYKHWIDFQKTNANIVIKIDKSRMYQLARYEFSYDLPQACYKMELIVEQPKSSLSCIFLPINVSSVVDCNATPFLLASVPCRFWGKPVTNVIIDGLIAEETTRALEEHITKFTGMPSISDEHKLPKGEHEVLSSTEFAQLLVAWRFIEFIRSKFEQG